jgi:hypothetical protein
MTDLTNQWYQAIRVSPTETDEEATTSQPWCCYCCQVAYCSICSVTWCDIYKHAMLLIVVIFMLFYVSKIYECNIYTRKYLWQGVKYKPFNLHPLFDTVRGGGHNDTVLSKPRVKSDRDMKVKLSLHLITTHGGVGSIEVNTTYFRPQHYTQTL